MANREMTLREHLEELRKRLVIVAAAVVAGVVVAFIFWERVLAFLLEPGFGDLQQTKPIYTEVTEMIAVTMKASLMVGVVLALPVVLYQLIMFVAPGMTRREKVYLYLFLPATLVLFGIGVTFGYYVLLPPALRFLLTFGTHVATPAIRIGNYMNVITTLLFWMGLMFELPLVMFFLARLGIVNYRMLSGFRRYALILAFVLGAVITPTGDPVNQALMAGPLLVLYELGVWLARLGAWMRRRKPSPARR